MGFLADIVLGRSSTGWKDAPPLKGKNCDRLIDEFETPKHSPTKILSESKTTTIKTLYVEFPDLYSVEHANIHGDLVLAHIEHITAAIRTEMMC